jgi:diguanylate cyclase (GGDEF)-like protein/PAS domain S-box-containing protein
MNLQALLILGTNFLSALISILVGGYALRRWQQPGAVPFAALAFLEAEWTLAYVGQLVSPDLGGLLFWNGAQFLGATLAPLAFLAFSRQYSSGRVAPSRWIWRGACLAAVLMLGIIWTDSLHHLFRSDPHVGAGGFFPELVFDSGPLFFLFPFVAYFPVLFGTYALTVSYVAAPRVFRLQVASVLVGILIPWITTIITWQEWVPIKMHEITPVTFGISNLVVAWGLFRYHLFDLLPVAHATLVENMEDGVIVLNATHRIVDLNPAAQHLLGLSLPAALGLPFPDQVPALHSVDSRPGQPGLLPRQLELKVDGVLRTYEAMTSDLPGVGTIPVGALIQLRDVTHRIQAEDRLHQLAITDFLTGVINRRHFYSLAGRELEKSRRSGQPLSILLLDIDHFKLVNDCHGHQTGDLVLQEFTRRCQESLRPYDVFARYAGDEFVALLPESDLLQAAGTAERLRQRVSQPVEIMDKQVQLAVSIGVTAWWGDADISIDALLERADRALYCAKQAGRNQVVLDEKLSVK